MGKYRRLRDKVQASPRVEIALAQPATRAQLETVHSRDYLDRVFEGRLERHELRRLGLPWSEALVARSLTSTGATLAACRAALVEGVAVHLAGGTHHAFAYRCEGFCLFNDVAVALCELLAEKAIQRALVIDLDVHQGNGTAAIFQNEPRIFTLSLHGRGNFPFHKETSDLDVELEDGTDNRRYLELLDGALGQVEDFRPQLAVYLAGVDVWEGDRLGRLALTADGMLERDRRVKDWCAKRQIPLAVTMAGGYAEDVDHIATLHARTVLLFAGHTAEEVARLQPAPQVSLTS
jgi:acetoin utilization deacetylase AcuC-like enzyme